MLNLRVTILLFNWPILQVLLGAKGKDLSTSRRVLSYLLELGRCDLHYDVRDRARFLKKILSCELDSQGLEDETDELRQDKDLSYRLAKHLFSGVQPVLSHPINSRHYLPGSLSQLVLHAAPEYEPLPRPGSFLSSELDLGQGLSGSGEHSFNTESYNSEDDDSQSGSVTEESDVIYDSQGSETGSDGGGDESDCSAEVDESADVLIQFSDTGHDGKNENGASASSVQDLGDFMSKRTLETWLDEQPNLPTANSSVKSQVPGSSARISLGNIGGRVKPRSYSLLQPANGKGLKVDYVFSSEISSISPSLVCLEVSFENCSSEPMSKITLISEESDRGSSSADLASSQTER